ncbi:hypothetical protein Pfo_025572 [Paulownia fortunei]|nr:hypothetical protein Pfo_025572 [Paulownia fortunei]
MLIGGDCGLNLVLGFDDSLQKVLTQTMLNQEEIFRNQVLELHRLYEIQKILMKELDLKVNGEERPHSFVGPFSKNLKYESLATEMKLSEVHPICSSGSVKNHCLQEHRGKLKHQRIPLDLELPASHYTNDSEDLLCDCITPEVSAITKHSFYDDKVSSIEVLKLSLRADSDTWRLGSGKETCKDKIICSTSPQTIYLEGSTYDGDLIITPAPGYATHSGAKHDFKSSCSFRSRKNDAFDWISKSHSLTDGRPNLLEREHFHQGIERCHEDLSCKNTSARRKLFTSHEVGQLDLNKALPDESSVHPIDHWISNPSKCTSSGVSYNEVGEYGKGTFLTVVDWREPKNNYSSESSALDRQDIKKSTLTTSPSKDSGEHICGRTLCSVDLGSVCGPSSNKDLVSCSRNLRLKNAESEISLTEKTCQKISLSEMNVEKNKEDKLCSQYSSQELLEGTDSNRSPVSCKSDWITDDVSSNTKTGPCGIGMSNSNVSPSTFQNSDSSLVAKKLVQQDVVPSIKTKSQSSDPNNEELAEVDIMVRKGAVSLIYFSLGCLARNQDHTPESKKRKESCNVEREAPQSSSESYESIVLKQPECSVDEYCMSSTPFEVTSLDKKDHGVKLKRGRRMKDFRKEILPGLASLSRQEICEDIKIMELAIRSREYKKYRSKTASRSDCFSSVRSRRSRLSYVGRRYYS